MPKLKCAIHGSLWILLLFVCAGCGTKAAQGGPPSTASELFQPVESDVSMALEDPQVLRARAVEINFALLGLSNGAADDLQPAELLTLNLFEDATYSAELERFETILTGTWTWVGRVKELEGTLVTLSFSEGVLLANLTFPGGMYRVRPLEGGLHIVEEINPAAFPQELEPLEVDPGETRP